MEDIKFLDGFKPVQPIERAKELTRRAVAWATGFIAAGSTTELCLSEHIKHETRE